MSTISLILNEDIVAAGDRISGKLAYPTQTVPKEAKVELLWYTEGRGTCDRKIIDTLSLDPKQLALGLPLPFTLQTPYEGPISYNGALLRILWSVKVSIALPGMLSKKEEETQLFSVVCRGS